MKKFLIIVISTIIVLLIGCKESIDEVFVVPEGYRSWKKPVKENLTYPVPGHGDGIRIIYANDIAYNVLKVKDENGFLRYDFPDGSVIVKEIFKTGGDVTRDTPMFTIMVKDRLNSANQYGWLYYVKKPEGTMTLVKGKMCIGCHAAANDSHPYFDKNENEQFRDYIFAPF